MKNFVYASLAVFLFVISFYLISCSGNTSLPEIDVKGMLETVTSGTATTPAEAPAEEAPAQIPPHPEDAGPGHDVSSTEVTSPEPAPEETGTGGPGTEETEGAAEETIATSPIIPEETGETAEEAGAAGSDTIRAPVSRVGIVIRASGPIIRGEDDSVPPSEPEPSMPGEPEPATPAEPSHADSGAPPAEEAIPGEMAGSEPLPAEEAAGEAAEEREITLPYEAPPPAVAEIHCASAEVCPPVYNGTPVCRDGLCRIGTCNLGRLDCDGAYTNGCEVDVFYNPQNCGECGTNCAIPNAVTSCNLGRCVTSYCERGWFDCDKIFANGCESPAACTGSGATTK